MASKHIEKKSLPQPLNLHQGRPQIVGQKNVDRGKHVWYKREDEKYKCVLCGGVTYYPTFNEDCDSIEELTQKEREMCPPRNSLQPHNE